MLVKTNRRANHDTASSRIQGSELAYVRVGSVFTQCDTLSVILISDFTELIIFSTDSFYLLNTSQFSHCSVSCTKLMIISEESVHESV